MELHELEVLQRETGTGDHGVTVTRASVCARAAEVRAPVPARREHGLVRAEAVERAVLGAQRDHAHALALVHDEVERKVLDEEVGVVTEGLAVESVEEGMASTVGRGGAAVGLATLAELERLTTECTLVDFALLRS